MGHKLIGNSKVIYCKGKRSTTTVMVNTYYRPVGQFADSPYLVHLSRTVREQSKVVGLCTNVYEIQPNSMNKREILTVLLGQILVFHLLSLHLFTFCRPTDFWLLWSYHRDILSPL